MRANLRAIAGRDVAIAGLASALTALVAVAAARKVGTAAIFVPLGVGALFVVVQRPLLAVSAAVSLAILCEGPAFGLFTFAENLYHPLYKHLTPLDALVVLAAVAVALDVLRSRRPVRFPRELRLVMGILVLAMLSGVFVGRAAGQSTKSLVLAENVLAYLIVMPLTVANLDLDRRQVRMLLAGAFALALAKGLLGLAEVASGKGISIEGTSRLTYYEPTANWVVTIALLSLFAAVVARLRPPPWMLLGSPLLIASLVLSYRRSFWIAALLGLALVLVLALSPVGRRLLVPTVLFLAAAIWLLGAINFQTQNPIVKRAVSLSPTSLTRNVEDRYRLDERANVLAEVRRHPITGLGMLVPWQASARPLPIEHENGREYVHFAALWFWLKLGILGLFAYLGYLIATARLAWLVWRRSDRAIERVFGLASLCGMAGLAAAETTASFTGVDLRFTVVLGAQIGLLALLARRASQATLRAGATHEGKAPARVV